MTLSPMLDAELARPASGGILAESPAALPDDLLDYLRCEVPISYAEGEAFAPAEIYYVVSGLVHATLILPLASGDAGLGFYPAGTLILGGTGIRAYPVGGSAEVMAWDRMALSVLLERPDAACAFNAFLLACNRHVNTQLVEHHYPLTARLAARLLRLAGLLGKPEADGAITIPAITQEVLAREVGTSRVGITLDMAAFRRARALWYDRQGITIYPELLRKAVADLSKEPKHHA